MSSWSFYKTQYERLGYTIFVDLVSKDIIERMAAILQHASDDALLDGDESSHSWREINLETPNYLTDSTLFAHVGAVLPTEPTRTVQWLNIYRVNEYIGAHMDKGGEAQLMIPVEMPPAGGGGEIWVGARQALLPLKVGDALLFAAHRFRHGTTPVLTGQRVSLNVRMWLN